MASCDYVKLKWKRPSTIDYPKIWHTFKARDLNSNELAEYRIEDLPASRAQDAYDHLLANYIKDEPISQILSKLRNIKKAKNQNTTMNNIFFLCITDGVNDPDHFEDYKLVWNSMVAQKTPLVCFKSGSDEIVGLNMIFVSNTNDDFMKKVRGKVSGSFISRNSINKLL